MTEAKDQPLTGAQRLAALRERRASAGLKEVRNLWAHAEDHERIRAYVERITKQRARASRKGA